MVTQYSYPALTVEQQQQLPSLVAPAVVMPAQFTDSTHQLWRCETVAGGMILKVCRHQVIQHSAFWQGMNSLFLLDFPASLEEAKAVAELLKTHSVFVVPEVVAVKANQFILTRFLSGKDLDSEHVTDAFVVQLAHHLGLLHQQSSLQWGRCSSPELPATQWSIQLIKTLEALNTRAGLTVPKQLLQQAQNEAEQLQPAQFVPMMLDFRWDQLRQVTSGKVALVDLDAFVRGPRELELVLVEYLLSAEQAAVFSRVYQTYLTWPDLTACRFSYRLLLFLMHVLGVSHVERWLAQPTVFDIN